MSIELLTIILFASLLLLIVTGLPLVFCLGGIGLIFMLWMMGPKSVFLIGTTAFTSWTNFILLACPLFILMANILERSGLADDLYEVMYKWLGPLVGGLGIGTVIICAIFAAMAGISGVATVTMGLIALPSLLKRGYDKNLAIGSIAMGGTLGILIPPSVIMILYGSLSEESVGKLFMGGVFPGMLLTILFCAYIGIRCLLQSNLGPALPREERASWSQKMVALKGTILPILLIFLVLGVIYTGICTPTEAAGIGAFGALVCFFIRRGYRRIGDLGDALTATLKLTCMVMWVILGAKCYSHVYHAIGAPDLILGIISGLEVNRWLIIIIMQVILFILGMFLDPLGIMMITIPVFLPVVESLGFSLLWFGVLFTINMELGYITPPFGFNLFYMKSVVPKGVTMIDIYRAIIPFMILGIIGLIIAMVFPQLALWLPGKMITR